MKYLIEEVDSKYGIDPAANDNAAIQLAARGNQLLGHLNVVKYLMSLDIKYGIDPAANDNEVIRQTIRLATESAVNVEQDVEFVKYLMSLDSKYGIDRSAGQEFLSTI